MGKLTGSCIAVGEIETNCYLLHAEGAEETLIVDPGGEAGRIRSKMEKEGLRPVAILLTHGHFDHTGAVNEIRDTLGIPVLAHRRSDEYLLDARKNLSALCGPPVIVRNAKYLDDGDVIFLDSNPDFFLRVIYVPGHTTDSVMFYSETSQVAFVGDTIFKGTIGNYQYPGGDAENLQRSIIHKIFTLSEDTVLCSGHSEQTTVRAEKRRYRY
jgi:glyoxylase-like metal-dependent hydrolase (beta-lactamase superfamily II)